MHVAPGYILLLAKQTHQVRLLASSLGRSRYSVAITNSEEQAIAQTVQEPPFLIILAGDRHHWSQALLHELRCHANAYCITLIALTDFHAPYWVHQEENPGFDGFLVNPISSEVLSSLVQSAHTRQACYPAG